ncbi:SMc00767 family acetate metabolism repressor [Yunchengibacter salinarum]|uniref:SMc00767 family acetate metabolism repressor n=1 Tax=Yunchengibacter salinarum TaxID=3133399 RepID=UPI0035B5CDEA
MSDDKTDTETGADDKDAAIRRMANALHRLNDSVIKAVEAGVTVELMRTSRYHNEEGAWGDMLVPIIHKRGE